MRLSLTIVLALLAAGCNGLLQTEQDNNETQLTLAALAIAGASNTSNDPEIAGVWKEDASGFCNTTFTVSKNGSGIWTAYSDAITGCSFSATHTLRDYSNSLRRYYYECTAQTGGGCTVGQFGAVAWIVQGTVMYYCEYSSSQTTLAAAQAASASSANTSNTASGCGGFSWSKYNRN